MSRKSAELIKLASFVNYQDGAVVSREIINKPIGTVTVFAFDKDQGLSEHTAPFDALVHIIEGKALITVAETPHELKEGEMIVMPANQPHSLKAVQRFKMILIMIRA